MRIKLLIAGIVTAVAAALLIWISTDTRRPANHPNAAGLLSKVPVVGPAVAELEMRSKMKNMWRAPIEFYGKVVDENSNPVAGATVKFHWVEYPAEEGNRDSTTQSDSDGLFSLHGAHGPSLDVQVNKDGYYTSREQSPPGFKYGDFSDGTWSPDARKPVIYHLRRKGQGAKLITSENGFHKSFDVRVPTDNTPVSINLLKKKADPNGQIKISQNKPPWRQATEWDFTVEVTDGGLVENQDEFQYEAPETNYLPKLEYHFSKGDSNWTTHVTRKFYVSFGEPRMYGHLSIESDLSQETVFITYAINPTGSRNLEPAN